MKFNLTHLEKQHLNKILKEYEFRHLEAFIVLLKWMGLESPCEMQK